MSGAGTEPTAVLAIKLWREQASPTGLVARVTSTLDVARSDGVRTVTTTREELQELVGSWFDDFDRL